MPLVSSDLVVVTWLQGQFPAAQVCTETPADMLDVLPVIQVQTIGGSDTVFPLDLATVDVDVFANGPVATAQLAEEVRTSLRVRMPSAQVAGAFVARVDTVVKPHYVYYSDDAKLRRWVATYRLAIRSVP